MGWLHWLNLNSLVRLVPVVGAVEFWRLWWMMLKDETKLHYAPVAGMDDYDSMEDDPSTCVVE